MKMSKAIREFIEEQVKIKAEQSAMLAELKKRADEAAEKLYADKEKLKEKFDAELKSVMEKYNFDVYRQPEVNIYGAYQDNLPEVIAYENAKREMREKQRLATLNIIAEMELGGTKAELMEKLNNLQF